MIPITELPAGVTSLLKVRASGVLPRGLEDNVRLVMESFALYALNVRETIILTGGGVLTVGFAPMAAGNTLVPPGELWYCWLFTIHTFMNAGEAGVYQCAIKEGAVGIMTGSDVRAGIVGANVGVTSNLGPFWARPGTQFGAQVTSVTLAPTMFGSLMVSKFRV